MKQFTEEQVLKAIYESGLHQYVPGVITTRWKDGIDIDIPNHSLINFASKLFTDHEEEVKKRNDEYDEMLGIAYMSGVADAKRDCREEVNRAVAAEREKAKMCYAEGKITGALEENEAIKGIAEMLRDNKLYGPPDARSALNDLICAIVIRQRVAQ